MHETFDELAQASYKNSVELLDEASLLFTYKAYARAYALAELSCEEFGKAFLCKAYAVGLISDPRFRIDIVDHKTKLIHVVGILVTATHITKHSGEIFEAIRAANEDRPNARQILRAAFAETLKDKEPFERIATVFGEGDELKESGLYANLIGDEVIRPSEAVNEKLAKDAIEILSGALYSDENMFALSDEKFKLLATTLDPFLEQGQTLSDDFRALLKQLRQRKRRHGTSKKT